MRAANARGTVTLQRVRSMPGTVPFRKPHTPPRFKDATRGQSLTLQNLARRAELEKKKQSNYANMSAHRFTGKPSTCSDCSSTPAGTPVGTPAGTSASHAREAVPPSGCSGTSGSSAPRSRPLAASPGSDRLNQRRRSPRLSPGNVSSSNISSSALRPGPSLVEPDRFDPAEGLEWDPKRGQFKAPSDDRLCAGSRHEARLHTRR